MTPVISIENISKSYRLGAIGGGTLREDLSRWWARLRGQPDPLLKIGEKHTTRHDGDVFWALRDVSFQVNQGDVIGIIGRNGAGKSTLLKILSRVTAPTEGRIRVRGRIASLLEVGTGFHPELTGRENIFLNGAILGMTRAEIRRKFDEIVAFAEMDEFVDTPVKRYSSGMYVRLAFAVAAHLEPEILIVDEVLAVGDASFQRKCLGKMQDVAGHGRTVLFVSHNMAAVQRLCGSCVLLHGGAIHSAGDTPSTVDAYLSLNRSADPTSSRIQLPEPSPATPCQFVEIALLTDDGSPTCDFPLGDPIRVRVTLRCPKAIDDAVVGILLSDPDLNPLVTSHSDDLQPRRNSLRAGLNTFECVFTPNLLMPGRYPVSLGLVDGGWQLLALAEHVATVHVLDAPRSDKVLSSRRPGRLLVPFPWTQLPAS